ncbi:MAG: regulatory signaling modulator protein AmpE [Spongiibacteraceae bacterium]|jgi:AmpE protein
MEFFAVLVVLGLLQLWGSGRRLQRDVWFYQLAEGLPKLLPYARLRVAVLVGLPAVLVLLLQALFDSLLFGLLSLLLYVGILFYSLGRGNLSEQLHAYLSSWSFGNFESAYAKAIGMGDFQPSDAISDHISLHEQVRKAYIYESFERWFAVVFWFLLVGPVGAIVYRLSYLAGRAEVLAENDRLIALRFVHYLDWVPARLLAISFALAGNFVSGFKQHLFENRPAAEMLEVCAIAAINETGEPCIYPEEQAVFIEYGRKEISAIQSLLSRSVICWLVVVALITLL